MVRYLLLFFLLFPKSSAQAGELWLMAQTLAEANTQREQLIAKVGSYLSRSSKIHTSSLRQFRQEYPLYILPPGKNNDIFYTLRTKDGVILAAGILQPEDSLVMLLAYLQELEAEHQRILASNGDSETMLRQAYNLYRSNHKQQARILLRRVLQVPLPPDETRAAQELNKLLNTL